MKLSSICDICFSKFLRDTQDSVFCMALFLLGILAPCIDIIGTHSFGTLKRFCHASEVLFVTRKVVLGWDVVLHYFLYQCEFRVTYMVYDWDMILCLSLIV